MVSDLFPTCRFGLRTDQGALWAGQRNTGTVELFLPESIARAEHLDFLFETTAVAGYGSGKSRRVIRRTMFAQPLHVGVRGLGAGRHAFPFTLDLPPWLPPAYSGDDCSIQHRVELRLDVDWAIDPKASFVPVVRAPTREAGRQPFAARSPGGFHDEIAVEIMLDSRVLAQGEGLRGQIALRTGHAAAFDAVELGLGHAARVRMGRGDVRFMKSLSIRVPAAALRQGQSVPFAFPPADLPATQATGFLDLSPTLEVALDVAWWRMNRRFSIPLEVLPFGSRLASASAAPALLGDSRMAAVARDLAARTGLAAGASPVLVSGAHGMVAFSVEDASRGSETAAREVYAFPDLALGAHSRPLGILPAGRGLAPPPVAARWAIHCDARVPEDALRAFFASALDAFGDADALALSDRHLSLRRRLASDDSARWLEIVEGARARAARLSAAIAALPFPAEGARAAWTRTAEEEQAFLLPHLPALVGIRRAVRVASGEQREARGAIVTTSEGTTRVEVDLDTPLPPEAVAALGDADAHGAGAASAELLRQLRASFEALDVPHPQHMDAVAAGVAADPRALLPALDALVAWSLHARGERPVVAPYR